jgi:hypothetical protein
MGVKSKNILPWKQLQKRMRNAKRLCFLLASQQKKRTLNKADFGDLFL